MQDPNRMAGFEPTNNFYDEPEYMEDTDTGSLFDDSWDSEMISEDLSYVFEGDNV